MSDVNQAHLEKLETLPEGWTESTVAEIVQMVSANNKKLAQKNYLEEGKYPVIDQGQDFIGGYSDNKELVVEEEPPFIIFGDHTRIFKFANLQFVPGADGVKIMKPIDVEPKWCFYIFQSIRLPNKGYARHFQYLKEAYIPVPPPEQQKLIVAKIEELFSHIDAGIEALKKAKQFLKQYRQSVLKAAVTGELTKEWREANKDKLEPATQLFERILIERRDKWEEQQLEQFKAKGKMPKDDKWKEKYKEPEAVDVEPFDIPDGWCWVSLDTFLQNIEAGKSFKCDERPPNDGETGIVKVSAVTWGEFDSNESKTIIDKSKINPNYRIEEGNFLFSRANTIELVGACVIVKHVDKDLLLSDKILRFVMPNVWKEWVQLCLRTQHGRNEIESLATGNQESMRNIAQGNVRKIRIPLLPVPELSEMSTMVAQKMDAIARMVIELDTQLAKAEKNKQSILASAFSGKISA